MKKLISLVICLYLLPVYASEYSEFAEKEYSQRCNKEKVHIVVKMEYVEKYAQEIGNSFIPYIVYGYGDLKSKKCKKQRISYICLVDCEMNPVWSYVMGGK